MFDLSLPKLLVLGVLALLIFGPDQLPKFAAQAGRAIRELRRLAEGAQADLRENLGPEFSDFDIADLHPKNFVRKHLLDDLNEDTAAAAALGLLAVAVPVVGGNADPGGAAPVRHRRDLAAAAGPLLDRCEAQPAPGQPAAPVRQLVRDDGQLLGRLGVRVAEHQRQARVPALAQRDVDAAPARAAAPGCR